jgi:hypothetical protein
LGNCGTFWGLHLGFKRLIVELYGVFSFWIGIFVKELHMKSEQDDHYCWGNACGELCSNFLDIQTNKVIGTFGITLQFFLLCCPCHWFVFGFSR